MAQVINMPRLSDTMEEGVVAKWLVNVGDDVNEGDIIAEIETDKATMEFESFNEGTLLYTGLAVGDTAKVDDLLAIIGPEGTDISGVAENFVAEAPKTQAESTVENLKKLQNLHQRLKKLQKHQKLTPLQRQQPTATEEFIFLH